MICSILSSLEKSNSTDLVLYNPKTEGFELVKSGLFQWANITESQLNESAKKLHEMIITYFKQLLNHSMHLDSDIYSSWKAIFTHILDQHELGSSYSFASIRISNLQHLKKEIENLVQSTVLISRSNNSLVEEEVDYSNMLAADYVKTKIDMVNQAARQFVQGKEMKAFCDQREGSLAYWNYLASLEVLTTHLVYAHPHYKHVEKVEEFDCYLSGIGKTTYCYEKTFNLFGGLIACAFKPSLQEGNRSVILSIRGTQRFTHVSGFWGSLISVFHKRGPGANVLSSSNRGIHELEKWMAEKKRESRKIILTGHSMGGNIAKELFCKAPDDFESVVTFASPGRDDSIDDKWKSMSDSNRKKLVQIVHCQDPLAHIGRHWLGTTYIAALGEENKKYKTLEAGAKFHNIALLSSKNLLVWKMGNLTHLIPGFQWVRFLHRMCPQFCYVPIKLLVMAIISSINLYIIAMKKFGYAVDELENKVERWFHVEPDKGRHSDFVQTAFTS